MPYQTITLNLISLALLLPTALALPFNFSFFKGKAYEQPAWSFDEPHRHPHWSYTLTATTTEGVFPTAAPTAPRSYASYPTNTVGTGTAISSGPTATGYGKRDLEDRHFSFPTAFPTGAWPLPTAGTGTGTGFSSYPTAYAGWTHEHEHVVDFEHSWKEKRFFEGPRRHHGAWSPYWGFPSMSESVVVAPMATGASGYAAPTGTGYAAPSGTAPSVPTYGW